MTASSSSGAIVRRSNSTRRSPTRDDCRIAAAQGGGNRVRMLRGQRHGERSDSRLRERAAAGIRIAFHGLRAGQRGEISAGTFAQLRERRAEHPVERYPLAGLAIAVQVQRRVQRGQRRLVDASARNSGLARSRAIALDPPAINPACGPPKSLSPEKATRSTPSASASRIVRSCGNPYSSRSTGAPLPRSSTTSTPDQVSELREFSARDFARKTFNPVV